MFCRNCGCFVPDGSGFCPKCGSRVSDMFDDLEKAGFAGRFAPKFRYATLLRPSGWFSYSGRSSRTEYNLRSIILVIAFTAYFGVLKLLDTIDFGIEAEDAFPVMWIVLMALIGMQISVWTKRLHDLNHSAGLILIFFFLSAVLPILLIICIALGCLRGTEGDNRFGPDPRF